MLGATLVGAAVFASAAAWAAVPGAVSGTPAPVATTSPAEATAAAPKPKRAKSTRAKKAKKAKKAAKEATEAADTAKAATKRRKVGASPAYIVGDTSGHFIDETAPKIVPFSGNAKAFDKAFAENRREQLVDAEKAARAGKSPDRWRSVLFMLHGLPEHNDSETCFWRVLSFYRLDEVERARKVREGCELPAKDSSLLNAEDARATGTPSMEAMQEAATHATATGAPVIDRDAGTDAATPMAPYSGPSPQRRD